MEITVRAAARVIGLRVGQQAAFELTPFIQGLIDGGKLAVVEACDDAPEHVEDDPEDDPEGDAELDAEAEAVSRAKHPAGRALAAGG